MEHRHRWPSHFDSIDTPAHTTVSEAKGVYTHPCYTQHTGGPRCPAPCDSCEGELIIIDDQAEPCEVELLEAKSPQERLLDLHESMCQQARETMKVKNDDYSNPEESGDPFANFRSAQTFGLHPVIGLLLRVQDKLKRIESFAKRGDLKVPDEGWMDACQDTINYMILCAGLLQEGGEK